nr:hypothetical protein [Streptomyces sp. 846.5]
MRGHRHPHHRRRQNYTAGLSDGVQVLDQTVSLPPQVLVAFTGGNGSLTDTHQVTSPTISCSGGN